MRVLLLAFAMLSCATAPQRADQAVYGACAAYTIAAERGAEAVHAGLLPDTAVIEMQVYDARMNAACKAAFAMIRAGEAPDSDRLAATAELVNRALVEFERLLVEKGTH